MHTAFLRRCPGSAPPEPPAPSPRRAAAALPEACAPWDSCAPYVCEGSGGPVWTSGPGGELVAAPGGLRRHVCTAHVGSMTACMRVPALRLVSRSGHPIVGHSLGIAPVAHSRRPMLLHQQARNVLRTVKDTHNLKRPSCANLRHAASSARRTRRAARTLSLARYVGIFPLKPPK